MENGRIKGCKADLKGKAPKVLTQAELRELNRERVAKKKNISGYVLNSGRVSTWWVEAPQK